MQIDSTTASTASANAAAGSSSSASSSSSNPSSSGDLSGLANESTFLQLLVSQIKNQDPLNPTDSVQFLGQLTQLSQLEQIIGLRQDLKSAPQSSADANSGSSNTVAAN